MRQAFPTTPSSLSSVLPIFGGLVVLGVFVFAGPVFGQGFEYVNPLADSDVNTLLTKFLGSLQTIIGITALVFLVIGALIYITSAGDESRITWAKGAMLAALVGLAIAIAAPLFLREIGTILGWIDPQTTTFGTSLTLTEVLGKILGFLLGIVGVIAIIALVLGGFMYLTSAGDADRADTGKGIVKYAIIGILVALAGLVIITQVARFFE